MIFNYEVIWVDKVQAYLAIHIENVKNLYQTLFTICFIIQKLQKSGKSVKNKSRHFVYFSKIMRNNGVEILKNRMDI